MENPPAVASVDAPLILRRSPAPLAYVGLMGTLLLGAAALLAEQGSSYALPVAALGVVGTVWLLVVWARSRTEIGPEGILNRTIRAEVLIPWPEVVRVVPLTVPGTILVVRRGGRATTLAGLRGRRTRGLPGLGQVVDTIEARISGPDDSAPRPVPPVIVRRLRLAPARGFLVLLTALGLLSSCCALADPTMVLAAVLFLFLAGFVFAATRRALTEIGPDGIRNRALVRTVFVPWPDVAEVIVSATPYRTVRVVRAGGERMTLAAVRDSDIQVDGLGLDDLADIVRSRAAASPEPAAPLPAARSLSLRPSRRPLAWIVPSVLVTAGAAALSTFSPLLFMIFLVLAALLLRLAFRLLQARTSAGPVGLRNRFGLVTAVVAWSDIEEFVIVPTLFGRIVRVTRPPRRQLTLAAPREGLLGRDASMDSSVAVLRALAAESGRTPGVRTLPRGVRVAWWVLLAGTLVIGTVVAKPWLEPWWPARHEATRLPRACDVLSGANPLVPDATTRDGDGGGYDTSESATSSCMLGGAAESVDLDLALHRRQAGRSGTQVAARLYAAARPAAFAGTRPIALPGLGDEAWEATGTTGDQTTVRLLARRHNVRVQVNYLGGLPAGEAAADARALARTALLRVPDSH